MIVTYESDELRDKYASSGLMKDICKRAAECPSIAGEAGHLILLAEPTGHPFLLLNIVAFNTFICPRNGKTVEAGNPLVSQYFSVVFPELLDEYDDYTDWLTERLDHLFKDINNGELYDLTDYSWRFEPRGFSSKYGFEHKKNIRE